MLHRRHFITTVPALVAAPTALLALPAHAQAAIGQPAPAFTLRDATGKTVRLADFKGRHVVLEWTNPGCPFVQKHYDGGNIPATQKRAVDRNVVWLAINSTEKSSGDYLEPARLAGWMAEKRGVPTAVLMDEDGVAGRAYAARTTPHLYIVDPQGRLIYAGGIDSIASARADDIARATNYVDQALAEALAGKPVSQAVTRPYGCSIKYKI
ncbi:MAG: thioredoxin family protein [Burkholderiaceae bacterium]|nr:thioredoxin family protein [Burkholderiaceae bacterium]